MMKSYLVAVVFACTAELQKSLRTSGSLSAAMQALKGILALTVGVGPESASSRRRSASCSSSVEPGERGGRSGHQGGNSGRERQCGIEGQTKIVY